MRANQFEALGARRVYAFVAGLVHEPLLPATNGAVGAWSQGQLRDLIQKAQYFSAANLCRSACYIPQAIAFCLVKYWPGLTYVVAIWSCHLLLVYVEAYKRALSRYWMDKATPIEPEPERPKAEIPPGIYRLRKFETETFYRWLGLEFFRVVSTNAINLMTFGFSGKERVYIAKPSRQLAITFERETRMSEAVHLGSAVTIAPLVVFSWLGAPLGIALWSTFIIWGDVWLALLQRYHRVRVWPVIQRMLERKK